MALEEKRRVRTVAISDDEFDDQAAHILLLSYRVEIMPCIHAYCRRVEIIQHLQKPNMHTGFHVCNSVASETYQCAFYMAFSTVITEATDWI